MNGELKFNVTKIEKLNSDLLDLRLAFSDISNAIEKIYSNYSGILLSQGNGGYYDDVSNGYARQYEHSDTVTDFFSVGSALNSLSGKMSRNLNDLYVYIGEKLDKYSEIDTVYADSLSEVQSILQGIDLKEVK